MHRVVGGGIGEGRRAKGGGGRNGLKGGVMKSESGKSCFTQGTATANRHHHIWSQAHRSLVKAELVENRIIVWSIRDSKRLFAGGYYGKPIGIPKPKPEEIDAPLILDLIEGYYLLEKGRLKIHSSKTAVTPSRMRRICNLEYNDFEKKYQVYKSFKDKGYIVNPGIKFGCDFAVYEKGPGIDHAPYLVQVYSPRDSLTTTGVVLAGRLATTVHKQFILAVPRSRGVDFLALDWWRA